MRKRLVDWPKVKTMATILFEGDFSKFGVIAFEFPSFGKDGIASFQQR